MALTAEQQALDFNPELQDVSRQRKLAELLMAQGMQQPQGQMISGQYVAPSWTQQLNPIANILAGQAIGERADTKQQELAQALRGKKLEVQKAIQQKIDAGDLKGALAIATQNQEYGGKEFIAPLMGNVIPKATQPTSEMQNYEFAKTPAGGGFKGSYNDFVNQMTPYQRASLAIQGSNQAQSRVPMGYRMTKDGGLEPIPGGPADQKAQTVNAGRETVDTLIGGLKDQYGILKKGGGITSTESGIGNIPAYLSSTGAGQQTGKFFGTQNQSARNTIVQSRPLLLAAIKNATGMSAKQMDSNVELKMYLAAATDPSLDYEANMAALNQLESLYGIGGGGSAGNAGGGSNLPSASEIAAEKARRQGKK
jgi:hypothetical protein